MTGRRTRAAALAAADAAALAGLAAAGWLALMHARMVASPAPQEMREGAVVWITRLLLEGRSPYDPAELPASANLYGIGYHLAVLPFAAAFGNGFEVHRAVSAAAVAGTTAIAWALLRRAGCDRLLAATGAAVIYVSSLYFVAPLARPDALGLLLSVAAAAAAARGVPRPGLGRGPGSGAFALCLLLGMCGLATKAYFALPPFAAAAYVFLWASRARGLAYLAAACAASAGTLALLSAVFPGYAAVSLLANAGSADYDVRHLFEQVGDWLLFSLPLAAGAGALLLSARRLPDLRRPPPPWAFFAAAGAAAFVPLGGHPGAHLTYLFQLVTPALVLALFPALAARPAARAAALAALPLALAWSAPWFPWSPEAFRRGEAAFAALGEAVAPHGRVLGSAEAAGVLALAGRPVAESGQSEFLGGVRDAARAFPVPIPGADALGPRWDAFLDGIRDDVAAGRYDLVVRSRRPGGVVPQDLLAARYRVAGTVHLVFAWTGQEWPVDLWVPRDGP